MGKDTILSNDYSTEFDRKQQHYPYDKAPLKGLCHGSPVHFV